MFWFFLRIVSAFFWFCWAFGLLSYEPWLVTAAFIFLGIGCVLQAMKDLIEWLAWEK